MAVHLFVGDGWRRLYDVTKIKDVTNAKLGLSDLSQNAQYAGDTNTMPERSENVKKSRLRPALQAGKEKIASVTPEDAASIVFNINAVKKRSLLDPSFA